MVATAMLENSSENQVAFAAVFIEMFSADAECALDAAGLERERCYAATLHFAAEDFCAAASVPVAARNRAPRRDDLPENARDLALRLARNAAITCSELAMFAALESDNPSIRAFADKCTTFSYLLLNAVDSYPQRYND